MSTFTDDFNRGDGGLGNNWSIITGAAAIASNAVNTSVGSYVDQTTINASGRQECILSLVYNANADLGMGAWIKSGGSGRNGYVAYGTGTLAAPVWHVRRITSSALATDITVNGSGVSTGAHTLRLLYDGGILNLWIDGALQITVADSTHGALTGAGFMSNGAASGLNTYNLLGNETVTFTVSPDVVGNFGNSTTVSFVGVGTAWTTGTPGTPTFTVDHGTLSDQEVTSATAATATYTPGNFLGTATFADPSTGATDTVIVSSDPNVIPPVITTLFNQAFIDLANRTGTASDGGYLTATDTPVSETTEGVDISGVFGELLIGKRTTAGTGAAAYTDPGLLYLLWQMLNGRNDAPTGPFLAPGNLPLAHNVDELHGKLDALTSDGTDTLDSVMTLLGGDPFASHHTLLEAINAISTGDNQDVLDAIAAMQGDPLATIKAVLDLVYLLDPTGTHNLAELLTAISAVRGSGSPDLAAVISRLAQIQPTTSNSLDDILTKVISSTAMTALLDVAVATIVGPEALTLTLLSSQLDDVLAAVQAISANVPPVWIDEAHATVESSVPLADALELTGPLDGVIVAVTGHPSGAGKFAFGDQRSWRYVGAVVFQNDRGDWEWAQPIGLEAQVITPRTMQHASAARFRVESGWQGTARAFTVTAGA
jgi:hypothetical protein